jgi:hypothetical protein
MKLALPSGLWWTGHSSVTQQYYEAGKKPNKQRLNTVGAGLQNAVAAKGVLQKRWRLGNEHCKSEQPTPHLAMTGW